MIAYRILSQIDPRADLHIQRLDAAIACEEAGYPISSRELDHAATEDDVIRVALMPRRTASGATRCRTGRRCAGETL